MEFSPALISNRFYDWIQVHTTIYFKWIFLMLPCETTISPFARGLKLTVWSHGNLWERRSSLEGLHCLRAHTHKHTHTVYISNPANTKSKIKLSIIIKNWKLWIAVKANATEDETVPGAIWTLQPDSCWILLICSPPRPITGDKEAANCVLLVGHTCNSGIHLCLIP